MDANVKLVLLKSGEDLIASVRDLRAEEKTIGFVLEKPYIVKINSGDISLETQESLVNKVSLTFYPYIPLTEQKEILIPADWVVTIVDPIGDLKKMYVDRINENGNKTNKNNIVDEQSDSNQSD
jgi:hypothetical protein